MPLKRTSTFRRLLTTAVIVLCSAASATACGNSSQSDDTQQDDTLLGSVETHYGTIDIPRPDDGDLTVVALGWSDGEIALSLGVKPVAIYDWQSFGEEDKGVGPWATDQFGDETPTVMPLSNSATYDYEEILSFEPDLILNVRAALDDDAYERLSQIAPTVQAPEDTPDYAVDWRTQNRMVAEAIGKPQEGEAQVAALEDKFERTRNEHPEFDGRSISVGSRFGDSYGVTLPGDPRLDIYTELGFVLGDSIDQVPNSGGFYGTISAEQLSLYDSDVAVLFTIGLPLSDIEDDPLVQNLPVVRDGRALFVDPDSSIIQGTTAGTVTSLTAALDEVTPRLSAAVETLA